VITKVQKELKYNVDYKQLDLELVQIGTITPYNIYIKQKNDYVIIVKVGTLIDEKIYNILLGRKVFVSKSDLDKVKLECRSLLSYVRHAKSDSKYCLDLLYKMNDIFFDNFFKSKNYTFEVDDVEGIVKSVVFLVKDNSKFVKENLGYFKNDNLLAHHSLNVCIYSVNIGNALEFNDTELLDLGIAGYLQDIGLRKIDETIVSKDSALSKNELENIHKHTMHSVQIVQHNCVHRPDVIDGIRHHHENFDGSGYPDKLGKEDISKFAAILSICDVFDALTSIRPYRKEKSSFEALTFMMKEKSMVHRFNHHYIKLFIRMLLK
jgi:HD-GYP domain-containing protein (c-di-GMP phosphodiesterase class II)